MADAYERYVHINLPHSRTVLARIGRMLELLDLIAIKVRPAVAA